MLLGEPSLAATSAAVNACAEVVVTAETIPTDGSTYAYNAQHLRGNTEYRIENGTGVTVAP